MVQVGDTVICLKVKPFSDEFKRKHSEWCAQVKQPKVGKRYTIRGFYHYKDSKIISVCLEEIRNTAMQGNSTSKIEVHFPIDWFEKADVLSIKRVAIEKELNLN